MRGKWRRIVQVAFVSLATAAFAAAETTNMPPPGTLNYVEGQVTLAGHKETPDSVGSTYLAAHQVLDTSNGNAEMLLTPGVFLRLGHNSAVEMISPNLTNTQLQLTKGSALIEADELFKENNLSVVMGGATTHIEKTGLYDFTAQPFSVKVLDGKAITDVGDQEVKLKKGHEALLEEGAPVVRKYKKDVVENQPLYRWSKLRSDYASQSNVNTAYTLVMDGGWWGPGWYWDTFWCDFAFLPGDGILWGPFGPFFAPGFVAWAPYYGYDWDDVVAYHAAPTTGVHSVRRVPTLARVPKAGSPGFRPLPKNLASNLRPPAVHGLHSPSRRAAD